MLNNAKNMFCINSMLNPLLFSILKDWYITANFYFIVPFEFIITYNKKSL